MNRTNSVLFILSILAISIMLCSISSSEAADFENLSDGQISEVHSKGSTDYTIDDSEELDIKDEDTGYSDRYKKVVKDKSNLKSLPDKTPVTLETSDVTCNVGEEVNFNVIMTPNNITEGVLTLYIDDELIRSHNLSYLSPSYTIDSSDYVVGTHDVEITYSGSLNYESANVYAYLIVNKHESVLTNLSSSFREDNDLNVSFSIESNDEYLDSGVVDIYYLDELITSVNLENSNPSAVIPKEYNGEILTFKYYGDNIHDEFTSNELIYSKKLRNNIYVGSLSGFYGTVINSNIYIYSERLVNDGIVYLYIDDVLIDEYDVNSSSIPISIDLGGYTEGSYDVYVRYSDSDVYEDSNYSSILKVNKIKTTLYLNNISGYRNNVVNIKASVSNYVDDTDEGVAEIFIDEESIATTYVSNNTVSTDYLIPDTLEYGVHNLSVFYYGSNKYVQSNQSAFLTVNKYKSTVYLRNTSFDDDGNIVVNLRLYSYDNVVDDGVINCYVNGTLVSSADVKNNTCSITLDDSFEADKIYDVVFEYVDSDYFEDYTLDTQIQQNKRNTTLSISKYLSNKDILSLTSYIYSKDYSTINEGNMEFYLNDTLIGTSSVENNKASIEFNMTQYPAGNYTITAKYTGSKKYQDKQNTTQIEKTIKQQTIYINSPSTIKTTPNETITINANLTDYESNPITEPVNTTITIANTTVNVQFIDGYLNYTYQLPENLESRQNIIIKTQNSTYYRQATKNITLNIQRNSTYITSQNSYSTNKLDEIALNFTLNSNNEILKERTPAAIKINNITVYQGFFENGSLNYLLKLNTSYTQDEYTITAIAGQTTHYAKSTKDVSLKLKDRKTYIKSQNIYSKKGDKIQFSATLYDTITKKAITTPINMTIKINNITIVNTQSNKGQLIYTYQNNFNKENYEIEIKSSQTGIYLNSSWTGNLINTRDYIKVSTQNIYAKANSTISIKAKILKDNQLITSPIPVAIKINNITICNLNISNGSINYQYKLPDTFSQSQYNITIITGDTREYIQSTTTSKLIITKNYQQINTQNITSKTNSTITIKANITDINGNIIKSNEKVNIKIAGKSIADINAKNGIISYTYSLPNIKTGYYDLLIQTGETSCYYHATTHATLKVE